MLRLGHVAFSHMTMFSGALEKALEKALRALRALPHARARPSPISEARMEAHPSFLLYILPLPRSYSRRWSSSN